MEDTLFQGRYTARLSSWPSVDALAPAMKQAINEEYAHQVYQIHFNDFGEDFDGYDRYEEYRDEVSTDADGYELSLAVRRQWGRMAWRVNPRLCGFVGIVEHRVLSAEEGKS